jgi:tetratricopeptide (TPR) repeat protein
VFPDAAAARDSPAKLQLDHRRLLAAGRRSEAAEVEALFLERYPEDPRSYGIALARSKRLLAEGQAEPSLALARRAAAIEPSSAAPWVQQSLALEALKGGDESLHALDRALVADPYDAAAGRLRDRATGLRDNEPSRRIVIEVP